VLLQEISNDEYNLEACTRLLVVIAIHFLLRLAHNFSFGVDFMSFATQNNGMSLLPFFFTIVFTCHG
jgi:hypothetical protein